MRQRQTSLALLAAITGLNHKQTDRKQPSCLSFFLSFAPTRTSRAALRKESVPKNVRVCLAPRRPPSIPADVTCRPSRLALVWRPSVKTCLLLSAVIIPIIRRFPFPIAYRWQRWAGCPKNARERKKKVRSRLHSDCESESHKRSTRELKRSTSCFKGLLVNRNENVGMLFTVGVKIWPSRPNLAPQCKINARLFYTAHKSLILKIPECRAGIFLELQSGRDIYDGCYYDFIGLLLFFCINN